MEFLDGGDGSLAVVTVDGTGIELHFSEVLLDQLDVGVVGLEGLDHCGVGIRAEFTVGSDARVCLELRNRGCCLLTRYPVDRPRVVAEHREVSLDNDHGRRRCRSVDDCRGGGCRGWRWRGGCCRGWRWRGRDSR